MGFELDEALRTTRSVRRRLDLNQPVSDEVLMECLELAIQAPSGSNREPWRWIVVRDQTLKAELAKLYRRAFDTYEQSEHFAGRLFTADPERSSVQQRVGTSAAHLAANLEHVPVLVVPCVQGRPATSTLAQLALWGSIMPAMWSFMLAARARGLGTCLTGFHLAHEEDAARLLGIPHAEVTQAGLIPVAHYQGEGFRSAARRPLTEIVGWDGW